MATVSDVSSDFVLQRRDMRPCHDLMGGTDAMRRVGELYMEKGRGEPNDAFASRLKRTVLLNVFRRTLNFLRGQVFQKSVTVGGSEDSITEQDMERFRAWSEDVDKRGMNLTAWAGSVFRRGIQDGVTFAIVDYSAVETRNVNGYTEYKRPDGAWARKTKEADASEGWNPYLVHVRAEQVLDAWGSWEGEKYIIEHFRYIENVTEPDGEWAQKTIQQIRVFRRRGGLVEWETYRNTADKGKNFISTGRGRLTLQEIPVVMFMPGDPRGAWTAEPALIDLAWLNIRHWQVSGGHAEMMEYVQRPVWFGAGLPSKDDDGKDIIFGAGKLICAPEGGTLQSVGVDPASYTASRTELQSLEEAMSMYGLQLLQPKQVTITATESARDSEENNSTLKTWALDFQDFLENCLRLVGAWWGMDDGPSVTVNTDFARPVDMNMLLSMQRSGLLSAQSVLSMARALGVLPDDFSVEDEAAKIAREAGQAGPDGEPRTTLAGILGSVNSGV